MPYMDYDITTRSHNMIWNRPWVRIVIGIAMIFVALMIFVTDGIRISSIGFLLAGMLNLYYAIRQL